MRQGQLIRLLLTALAAAIPSLAAEYAVLETGFRIRAAGHEPAGDRVRLFLESGGVIEIPATQVLSFEREDYVAPAPATPALTDEEPFDLNTTIKAIAGRTELPEALVHSVIAAESAYNPAAVSVKGAIGLMQLMPDTARELEVNPLDPEENVQGGASYLKQLLERYTGSDDQLVRALAAYNAGPGAVERYKGLPPYSETRAFVRRVIERFLSLTEKGSAK
jgi:soluble lytic murein transglycosylase-like protein